MIVGIARERIDPTEEGPAHHALHTVINPDFIRDHNLRAIPPCHARMLPIGSRCLGPVGRRLSQRRNGQMYQGRSRLSSSRWKRSQAILERQYQEAITDNKIVVFVRDNENQRLTSMVLDKE